jgi:CO/xanthine dehydrogenase FAD-binding subunit
MVAYYQPKTLDHALQLLAREPGLAIIAGGTDIYPAKATRAAWGHTAHADVLDISRIRFPRGVETHTDHWSISPLTTWTDIVRADLPPVFDGLKAAAREVGGVQIQNRGTLVGNICTASPAADGMPALLTLNADVEIESHEGVRRVPLSQFVTGYRQTALAPKEMVIGLRIPQQSGAGHFHKLGARRYLVISIAMVAAIFDVAADGTVRSARLAVGACSAVAQRLAGLEASLNGKPLSSAVVMPEHLAHLQPIDDVRATARYRQAAAFQLVRDMIDQAAIELRGAA